MNEKESSLARTPSRPEQTGAVPKRTYFHLYTINRRHFDGDSLVMKSPPFVSYITEFLLLLVLRLV